VQKAENSYEGGYAAARQLLALPAPPTAVVAVDDVMAIGVLAAARDMGLAVPQYVSVLGFDDMPVAAYVRPALTTVRQPIQTMGEQALELLLRMVDGEITPDGVPHIRLEPDLVVRASCGTPRQTGSGLAQSIVRAAS
jgi:DNA-binding LacI/PurR family transcriptional regulator